MKCSHCDQELRETHAIQARPGLMHRSYICDGCGSRVEAQQERGQAVEVLVVGEPRAVIEARQAEEEARRADGIKQFLSIGGRRHVHNPH